MKSVGIITMHRVKNCGSLLQAYALQRKIVDYGYLCEIIDYKYPNKNHLEFLNQNQTNKKNIKYFIGKILFFFILFGQKRKMELFLKNQLNLSKHSYKSNSELKSAPPIYDMYCAGSDQIWNPRFNCNDDIFYMSFVPEKKKIFSYASSCALKNVEEDKNISFLKRFSKISVREQSSQIALEKKLVQEVSLVCDPTLLLTKNEWNLLCKKNTIRIKRPYILFYILTYSYNPYPELDDLVSFLIKTTGLYPVFLYGSLTKSLKYKAKNIYNAGPLEFLQLIRDAELVVTSSFHGTCFSILQQKQFYSLVKSKSDIGDERLISLLSQLGLTDRALEKVNKFEILNMDKIDYCESDKELNKLRATSIKYLKNALND